MAHGLAVFVCARISPIILIISSAPLCILELFGPIQLILLINGVSSCTEEPLLMFTRGPQGLLSTHPDSQLNTSTGRRAAAVVVSCHLVAKCKSASRELQQLTNSLLCFLLSPESLKEADEENVGRFLAAVLYPDETLLNRYAAMIYTSSDKGRIFEELPGADMCHSCAEKVTNC